MIGDTADLLVKLRLDSSGWTAQISQAQSSLTKLNKTATGTSTAFGAVAKHIGGFQKNIGRAFTDLGRGASQASANIQKMAFAAGALSVGAGVAAVKWAGDFQAQLQTINTIAFATPDALNQIGDSIRKVALDTGQSLDDLTGAYYDLLSAGVKTADAQSVLNNAVTLGIGGLATTTQTVDLLTTAYNAYGLTAAQTTQATDMFAQAIADGKVKADQISETFANVASVAKAYNIGINQIAASYGFLTAQGVPAAEVTTEMNRAIISLVKTSPSLDAAQKKLKVNFADVIKTQGLVPALQMVRQYSDQTGIPLIKLLGRIEAVKYALQTTGTQQAGFNAELNKINTSSGMAAKQAAERQQGLNFELAKFKAAIHDAGIEIGTALIPKITPLIKQLDDFLVGHRDDVKRFAQDLADGFQHVAEWVAKINFGQIADSLRFAGSLAKGLISAFLAAPQWLQTAVVTGWGLNKLTGGAVQNIMADLTKAAIGGAMQQFIARGATPANPLFVAETGLLGGGLNSVIKGGAMTVAMTAGTIAAMALAFVPALLTPPVTDPKTGQYMYPNEDPMFGPHGPLHFLASGYDSVFGTNYGGSNGPPPPTIEAKPPFGFGNTERSDMAAITAAVAKGTELGLIHSGVFQKAQAVREAGGFKLSRDALIAQLHGKTPLGTDALVTGEAIALAVGNHLRTDRNPDLKSAANNLALLKRLQSKLPHDLAAQLAPKIHSLEVAINRTTASVNATTAAIRALHLTYTIQAGDTGKNVPGRMTYAGKKIPAFAEGGIVPGPSGSPLLAVVHGGEKITPQSKAAAATNVFVTNWPKSVDSTSRSSTTTAQATSALAKASVKETTQQQMAAALKAIKERAIAAGFHGTPGKVKATYEHDVKRGLTINQIIHVPKSNVTIRDVNTSQDKRIRWGKTPTQVGAS